MAGDTDRVASSVRSALEQAFSELRARAAGKPVFVNADELFMRQASKMAVFTGRVRAWQDNNTVLANELHRISSADLVRRDFTLRSIRDAVEEVFAQRFLARQRVFEIVLSVVELAAAAALGMSRSVAVFAAACLGDLATYGTTSLQLAWAFPDPMGGMAASLARFAGIFALTQVPIAISEGLLTVLVVNAIGYAVAPTERARLSPERFLDAALRALPAEPGAFGEYVWLYALIASVFKRL